MNILLIGGTGVLSTDIVQECLSRNFSVTVINRGNHISDLPKEVTFLKANIRNEEEVIKIVDDQNFDVIVDFLSTDPKDFERTYSIFANKCRQYVYISSACVFRRSPEDRIIMEDSPKPNINSLYSIQKYQCEKLLKKLSFSKSSRYTIIRPYITYNNNRIPFGIMPTARFHGTVIKRIQAGKPMFLWGDGNTVCTLTHTKDFAHNFVQLLGNERAFDTDFNLVGNFTYTWKEVLQKLYDVLNIPYNVVSIPASTIAKILPCYKEQLLGDRSLNAFFDNTKLKTSIDDYRQEIDLDSGLRMVVDNYIENAYISGIDYQYDSRVDKLLSKVGVKGLHYIDYLEDGNHKQKRIYRKYRYLSENIIYLYERLISFISRI